MIRNSKGELICECNECGEEYYGGVASWQEFIGELKDDGWKIKKDGEEWIHLCPDCK